MANPVAESQFRLVVTPRARLFDQIREVMRFDHYVIRTEKAYTQWIQNFLVFHRQKDRAGPDRGCPSRSAFANRSASPKLPARDCRRGCCGWDTRAPDRGSATRSSFACNVNVSVVTFDTVGRKLPCNRWTAAKGDTFCAHDPVRNLTHV